MKNWKQFDLYGWNALKGQKLLAQGNALGIKAISKAPCKGKSFETPGAICKAFALTGRVFKIYQFFDTFFASKYKLIHTKSTC